MPSVVHTGANIARPINTVAMQDIYPWQVELLRMQRDYISPPPLINNLNSLLWQMLELRVNYTPDTAVLVNPVWGRVYENLCTHGTSIPRFPISAKSELLILLG